MTEFLGFDLNGLWDFVAEAEGDFEWSLKDLGVHGAIIRLNADLRAQWVGGSQAAQAPHGKGPGWGQIGTSENRLQILNILSRVATGDPEADHVDALRDFLGELTAEVRHAVFAVSDVESFDEGARDRYLRLLAATTRLRPSLLWRPVAALLGWLERASDYESFPMREGRRVSILSSMGAGLQLNHLTLIRKQWREEFLWVPERDKAGLELGRGWAGVLLARRAAANIAAELGVGVDTVLQSTNAPWLTSVGAKPPFELLRMANRSWIRLPQHPPTGRADVGEAVPEQFRSRLLGADMLLIEGPLVQNEGWIGEILNSLKLPTGFPVYRAPRGAVAHGCLVAAKRAHKGAPVYYDFLPQLEINALEAGKPTFVELIPRGTRLSGGGTYRGDAPGEFAIGKGAKRLAFYIFKEDLVTGRKAEVELPEEAQTQHRINVRVEQSPGQGFARVRIDSPSFEALRRQPLELEWARMDVVNESQEEILATLSGESGLAYPETVTTPGHAIHWHPRHRAGDIVQQLRAYIDSPLLLEGKLADAGVKTLQVLRGRFSRPENPSFVARGMGLDCSDSGVFRPLNGNGSLPPASDEITLLGGIDELLNSALAKAADELEQILHQDTAPAMSAVVGDLIGFATWCFWRCPPSTAEFLLAIYEGTRRFLVNPILLREGLGRTVHSHAQLERYFSAVDSRLAEGAGLAAGEFAAIGRVLKGVEDAADLIPRRTATAILQETSEQIADENRLPRSKAYKRKFKFALLMLAALLRHRRVKPGFLDPHDGVAGRRLLEILERSHDRNKGFSQDEEQAALRLHGPARNKRLAAARRFHLNGEIIAGLIDFVCRKGTDPNIIRKIEDMEGG